MSGGFPGSAGQLEFGDVAAKVAALADILPGQNNPHREALRQIAAEMRSPTPSLHQATVHGMGAMFDLFGKGQIVDKPETWLLCACAMLIGHEEMRIFGGVSEMPAGKRPS